MWSLQSRLLLPVSGSGERREGGRIEKKYQQKPSSEAATITLLTKCGTLGLLIGSWKKRKIEEEKDGKVK